MISFLRTYADSAEDTDIWAMSAPASGHRQLMDHVDGVGIRKHGHLGVHLGVIDLLGAERFVPESLFSWKRSPSRTAATY